MRDNYFNINPKSIMDLLTRRCHFFKVVVIALLLIFGGVAHAQTMEEHNYPIEGEKNVIKGVEYVYSVPVGFNNLSVSWSISGGTETRRSQLGSFIWVRWEETTGFISVTYQFDINEGLTYYGESSLVMCLKADAGPDRLLCHGSQYPNLNTFDISPQGGQWSGSFVSPDGTVSPNIPVGNHIFTYTTNPCYNYVSFGPTSDQVTVTVLGAFNAPSVSQAQIYTCKNESHSVTAGSSQGTVFKWYAAPGGSALPVYTGSTFTYAPPDDQPHDFYVCVLNQICESPRTKVSFLPNSQDLITGDKAGCAPLSGTITVNTSNSINTWQRSYNNGISWDNITEAPKTSGYTYTNVIENCWIRAMVNKGICVVPSQAAVLTINRSVGGKPVADYTVNQCGNIQGTITLGSSKTGDIKAWYVSNDNLTWKSIENIDLNAPLAFHVTDTAKYFYADVQLGSCSKASSEVIAIQAKAFAGAVKVLSQLNCHSASGTLELTRKFGEVQRWEKTETPDKAETWKTISNTANPIYSFNNLTSGTAFRAVVKVVGCPDSAYSEVASILISNPPIGVLSRSELMESCDSTKNPIVLKGQFKLKEYSGKIVRWEKFDSSLDKWQHLPDAADKVSYDYSVSETTKFRVKLEVAGCDDIFSGEATVHVNPRYKGTARAVNRIIKEYDGHSYISNGSIILSKGFKFHANSCQDFSITVDENYTLDHSNENFVLEETIKKEGIKDLEDVNWLGATDKQSQYNYFDGLGHTLQKVVRKASPQQFDLIQPIKYDDLGRVEYEFLPYVSSTKDGTYQEDFEVRQREFYIKDNDAIANSLHPFARKVFDGSPLNRVIEQGAPGTTWQPLPVEGGGKTIKKQYLTNSETDIKVWKVIDSLPVSNENYKPGQLTVNVSIDEHGFTSKEYFDKEGKTILKKKESKRLNNDTIWIQTYSIYNEFGKKCFVLSPEGTKRLQGNPDDAFLKKWAYCFKYDEKQRLIAKRTPGADWFYIFYDKSNRIRLTQTGTQRKKKEYGVRKYDDLSRTVTTALWIDSLDRSRSQLEALLKEESQWYEESIATGQGYTLHKSFPSIKESDLLTVTYYDDYSFLNKPFFSATGYDYSSEIGNPSQYNPSIKGFVTGSKVKILQSGETKWLKIVNYYDDKARGIQTIRENHIKGKDRITTLFDFSGKIIKTLHTHTGYGKTVITEDVYNYDHSGRLLTIQNKVDNNPAVNLSQNSYNELGELIEKNLHGKATGFLQSLDYRYNIRGWKTSINNVALNTDGGITNNDVNDVFGMEFKYDSDLKINQSAPQYNGNVAEILWKGKRDNKLRGYSYAYDPLNRLTDAFYKVYNGSTWNDLQSGRYDERIKGYDYNGNILGLKRKGINGVIGSNSSYGLMDNLSFGYIGNQLFAVSDSVPDLNIPGEIIEEFADRSTEGNIFNDSTASTYEYSYDENGNITKDKNKEIQSISYNFLDLPETIRFSGNRVINFLYDANGTRLRKAVDPGNPKTIDYSGIFEYKDTLLSTIATSEGRILKLGNGGVDYQYYLKDNIGNIRMVIRDSVVAKIIQEDHYYPFGSRLTGLSFDNSSSNQYLYNGKVLNSDYALNWYSYGDREYDPVLGRWFVIDEMASYYNEFSPYNYCLNNPINIFDPNGMYTEYANGDITITDPAEIESFLSTMNHNPGTVTPKRKPGMTKGQQEWVEKILKKAAGSRLGSMLGGAVAFVAAMLVSHDAGAGSALVCSLYGEELLRYNELVSKHNTGQELDGFEKKLLQDLLKKKYPRGYMGDLTSDFPESLVPAKFGDTEYTKKGRRMHDAYKLDEVVKDLKVKEYTIPGTRRRIDFIDFTTNTIYELKPNNERQLRNGRKQLNDYKKLMEELTGETWDTVLDPYN